jgi:hypothetical protein
MYGIGTGGLAPLRDLHALVQRVTFLLPWHDIVAIHCTDLHLHVEFAANFGADRRNNVEQEARTICQRAAVLVCPVVNSGAQELCE